MVKWLMINILIGLVYLQVNIELNKEISMDDNKSRHYVLDWSNLKNEKKILVLSLEKFFKFSINIKDKQKTWKKFDNKFNFLQKLYIPFDTYYFKDNFKMIFSISSVNKISKFKFELIEYFEIETWKNYNFISYFSNYIDFKVKIKDEKNIDRIQFYVDSSIYSQSKLKEESSLDLFINKKNSVPTFEDHDLSSDGNYGFGWVKTIRKNDEEFCYNCEYFSRLNLNNIEKIVLVVNTMKNPDTILIESDFFSFYEQIIDEEKLTYELDMKNYVDSNYNFSIKPISGEVNIYINFNTKPEILENYRWKSKEKFTEDIFITNDEIKKLGNLKKFILTIKPKNNNTETIFNFTLSSNKQAIPNVIKVETVHSGKILNNNLINYYLPFNFTYPEQISFLIDLNSENGNSDLYIKECNSNVKCSITLDEIKNKENLKNNKLSYFNYSDKSKGSDNLLLNFNCIPKGQKNKFKNSYMTSNTCKFVIGIYGNDNQINTYSSYNLMVSGFQQHKNVELDKHNEFEIYENKEIYLRLTNDISSIKSIIFQFFSSIGNVDIYFSRMNPYPSVKDNINKITFNDNKNYVKMQKKILEEKSNEVEITGNYYFTIKAKSYSIVILNPISKFINNEEKTEELISSKTIQKEINNKIGFKSFYFESNIKKTSNNSINLILQSIIGNFKICLQKNIIRYDKNLKCDIEETSNFIEIKSNNPNYLRDGVYCVTIIDMDFKPNVIDVNEKSFKLTYYYSSQKNNLELKMPGSSFRNIINSSNDMILKINISMAKNRVVIIFDSFSFKLNLYGSITINVPDSKNSDFILNYWTNSIILKEDFLNKYKNHKYLYLRISSSSVKNSKFNLSYTVDDYPIILYDSKSILALSTKDINQPISYKYQINKENDLNINLNNFSNLVNCDIYLQDNNNKNFQEKFKMEDTKNDELKIPKTKYYNLRNPILLIKINMVNKIYYSIKNKNDNEKFQYYKKKDLSVLEISNKINELKPMEPIERKIRKGNFKYFFLELEEEKDFMITLISKTGETDLYIQEGKFNFPNQKNYYKKQASIKNDEINIKKSEFKNKKMTKIWTVGVYAKKNSKFDLIFVPNFEYYSIIKSNKIYEFNLVKNKDFFLNYFNNNTNKFKIHIWSENSNIELFYDSINEKIGQNLIDNTEEKDFKSLGKYEYQQPPKIINFDKAEKNLSYIFDIKNLGENSKINFILIESDKNFIELSSNKYYDYVFNKGDEQIFKINFNNETEKLLLRIDNDFGEVELIHNPELDVINTRDFETSSNKLLIKNKGNRAIKVNINKNVRKVTEYVIFKSYYLKFKANKYSKISILAKNYDSYIELREGIPHNFKTSKDETLYFYLELENVKKEELVKLYIKHNKNFELNYEYLFMINNSNINFDNQNLFMPLSVENMKIYELGLIVKNEAEAFASNGIYLIKIPPQNLEMDIQVNIYLEKKYIMKPNSYLLDKLEFNKEKNYKVNLPFSGVFKIFYLSCERNLEVKTEAINGLITSIEEETYIYDDSKILNYNNTQSLIDIQSKYWNTKTFKVVKPSTINIKIKDVGYGYNDYSMNSITFINEFKPKNQKLFLKEYFLENNKDTLVTKFDKHLNIKFKAFSLSKQFSIDFKHIDQIKVSMDVYVFGTQSLLIYQRCGFINQIFNNKSEVNKINKESFLKHNIKADLLKKDNFEKKDYFEVNLGFEEYKINKKENLEVYVIAHAYLIENTNINFIESQYASFPMVYFSIKQKNIKIYNRHFFILFLLVILIIIYLIYKYGINNDKENINNKVPRSNEFQKINRVEMQIKK